MADGRPAFPEEQYHAWLEAMRPFLQNSNSLYYSIEQAGLLHHKEVIYRKYRLKDWFLEKIDMFRRMPGELVNDTIVTLVRNINDKVKRKESLTSEEAKLLTFYAEKSRAAQPFFVNRQETAKGQPIEDIIDELEKDDKPIDDVTSKIKEQMVATEPPVQDQGQAGAANTVPPQPDATETSA